MQLHHCFSVTPLTHSVNSFTSYHPPYTSAPPPLPLPSLSLPILLCADRIKRTVHIDTFTVDIEEKGVKLRLTVVDTPGFGDAVDNTDRSGLDWA